MSWQIEKLVKNHEDRGKRITLTVWREGHLWRWSILFVDVITADGSEPSVEEACAAAEQALERSYA